MGVSGMRCVRCGQTYPAGDRYFCEKCGGILELEYAGSIIPEDAPLSLSFARMPVKQEEMEGFGTTPTPLLLSRRLAQTIGLKQLYFKCEMANLTGSFKDRPVAVAVAMAKRFGYQRVGAASSGNAAAATAACAARLGLESVIVLPAATPQEKVRQTTYYGAHVFKVAGPYSNSYRVALDLSREHGVYNVTTTFLNPYAVEGDKLVGYELYEELGRMPGHVYVPVGAGPLLVGIAKGLREYAHRDGIECVARMTAVQALGNSPIAEAFTRGEQRVHANPLPNTLAGGIADGLVGYEQDGEYTLRICRESGGTAMSVSDERICEAQALLATEEGLFVEPSAAASLAGILEDLRQGRLNSAEPVVAVLTGHGLKDMDALPEGGEAHLIEKATNIADVLY
mgnify:CR=1 FL=1